MIDHISLAVTDLARAVRLYDAALAPLGLTRLVETATRVAFGSTYPEVWLNARPDMLPIAPDTGAHVCLRTRSVAAVDAFHAAALASGASDDGTPGLRQATQVIYYAAFIRDHDGNRLEVMTVPALSERQT